MLVVTDGCSSEDIHSFVSPKHKMLSLRVGGCHSSFNGGLRSGEKALTHLGAWKLFDSNRSWLISPVEKGSFTLLLFVHADYLEVLNSGDVGLRLKAIGFPLPPLEDDLSSFGSSEAVPVESLNTAESKPDEKIFDMVKYNQSGYSKYTRILLEVCCGEDSLMCSPGKDHDDCLCFASLRGMT